MFLGMGHCTYRMVIKLIKACIINVAVCSNQCYSIIWSNGYSYRSSELGHESIHMDVNDFWKYTIGQSKIHCYSDACMYSHRNLAGICLVQKDMGNFVVIFLKVAQIKRSRRVSNSRKLGQSQLGTR